MSNTQHIDFAEIVPLIQERREELLAFLDLQRALSFDVLAYLAADPAVLVAQLGTPDVASAHAAAVALWGMRDRAPAALIQGLGETDDPRARAVILYLLRRMEPGFKSRLLDRMIDGAVEAEVPRLMRAYVESGGAWGLPAAVLLVHPSREVRRAVGALVATAPLTAAERLSILMRSVSSDNVEQAVDAIRAMGAVGGDEAVTYLHGFLKRGLTWEKPNDADVVHREACLAMGMTGSETAVPILTGILSPGLAGRLLGRAPAAVRAAAVWGLAGIGGDKARLTIEKSATDSEAAVKAVAGIALDRMKGTTDDAPSATFDQGEFYALFSAPL